MKKYDAVLVVEGKTDKDHISNFLECDIITTNGSAVSCETINLIREFARTRDVVVLTDPDAPGKRIRDLINQAVPEVLNAYVPRDKSVKGKKLGVAECPEAYIIDALSHVTPGKSFAKGTLTMSDLIDCGLVGSPNSSLLRNKVSLQLHLGEGNAKTFLSRLNALGISKNQIMEVVGRVK